MTGNEIVRKRLMRKRMMWRIPPLVSLFLFLFWGGWYLFNGQIPTVKQMKWWIDTRILLPFPISHLWDIVAISLWIFFMIFVVTHEKVKDKDQNVINFGLAVGLLAGLLLGLPSTLFCGVLFSFVIGLIGGLFSAFLIAYEGLNAFLRCWIGFSLVYILVAGLVISLPAGLVLAFLFGLIFVLIVMIKFLFFSTTSEKIKNWLTGRC